MRHIANTVLILILIYLIFNTVEPIDPPGPDIEGKGVLILEKDRGDRMSMDADQLMVLTSTKIRAWCEDESLPFRLFAVGDEQTEMEDQWPRMIEAGKEYGDAYGYPVLVAIGDSRQIVTELPGDIDGTLAALEGI